MLEYGLTVWGAQPADNRGVLTGWTAWMAVECAWGTGVLVAAEGVADRAAASWAPQLTRWTQWWDQAALLGRLDSAASCSGDCGERRPAGA